MTPEFVLAQPEHLETIVDIYNQSIPPRNITADLTPVTVSQRKAWFEAHWQNPRYPLWVIVQEEQIIGWFSVSAFYGRIAYQATAEISIYLDHLAQGKGLGKRIIRFVQEKMPELGINTLLAFIFKGNAPSLHLFAKEGFVHWGELPNVANMETHLESLVILGYQIPQE